MSATNKSAGSLLPLGRRNYLWLLIGIAVLCLGYFLLGVDKKFIDAAQFSISLYVAPIVIFAGYGLIGYAIMLNPDKPKA
jgi:drug/metabolite transporter (DMT)-like permease